MPKFLTLTTVLFTCELLFLGLKSLALMSKRDSINRYVAVPCFIIETCLGFVLSSLFVKFAWHSTVAIRGIACMIIGIEVMCVVSEAMLVYIKVRGTSRELAPHQWGRTAIKWLCFGFGLLPPSIQIESAARLQTYGALSRGIAVSVQGAMVFLALVSCILSSKEHHLRIRMLLVAAFFAFFSLAAFVFSYLPRPIAAQQMTAEQLFSIIDANDNTNPIWVACAALILTTFFTPFAFWRLPDLAEHPLHLAHVLAAETAIFGVAPAVLLLGLVDAPAVWVVRQFMFTVFPISVALAGPLLFSFFITLGRQILVQLK